MRLQQRMTDRREFGPHSTETHLSKLRNFIVEKFLGDRYDIAESIARCDYDGVTHTCIFLSQT